jgi:outer membrane protein TolC
LNNNLKINLDFKSAELSGDMINEIRAMRYPWLYANVKYNFNKTENEAGFSLLNQNQGLNAGLTLSWNVFNGFNTGRQVKNAKINYQSSQLILEDTRSKIQTDLYIAFKKFESEKAILQLEESNLVFAKENVIVSLEAYRLGSISGIQLTEAQNSLEASYSRLIDARYMVKISETALMKLNGDLVK